MAQAKLKKDWRFYLGMICLFLSIVMPFAALLVPFLGLSVFLKTFIAGVLFVGGPEVMIILAAALLGNQVLHLIRDKVRKWFKRTGPPMPVSRGRYYFGLVLCLFSIVPLYVTGYFPDTFPIEWRFWVLGTADLTFVLSFFILGGDFWEKFKRLFKWEGKKHERKHNISA